MDQTQNSNAPEEPAGPARLDEFDEHDAVTESEVPPTDSVKEAAALQYSAGDNAPQIVASGRGFVADQIIAAARDAGVPIREDPALAKALAALDLGAEVPQPLYRAVAEALAWAYGLDQAAAKRLR
jgi:flagellar biosynthesis protein